MSTTFRRLIALLLVLAVAATSCRTTASIELTDAAVAVRPTAEIPDSTTAVQPEPLPTPTVPEPTPTTETAAQPEPPSGELVRPNDFVAPESWGNELTFDEDVTIGELENGLSYLIQNNNAPGGQAQLRLVVQAGSVHEEEGTFGAAHFLEHMMFNGTERFPGNEIVPVLEGFGAGFGADVNAYTSYEETVYILEVPARSSDTLQLGLDVLFEWATAATIDQVAVEAERGVVREEHRRSVEPLSGRIGASIREVLFAETHFLGRSPIGIAEVIENMDADVLRTYYERWYRPERMTVVAVGDFNPSQMEERIEATFGGIASTAGAEGFEIDRGPGPLPEPVFDIVVDREITRTEAEILWRSGSQPARTQTQVREIAVAQITAAMLNSRLFEAIQTGDAELLSASASDSALTPEHRLFTLSVSTDATDVEVGLTALMAQIEQARQHGFSDIEVARAVSEVQAQVDQQLAESDTRQDASIASELVEYALLDVPMMSAEDAHTVSSEVLASIASEDAQRYLYDLLATAPYVLVTGSADDAELLPTLESLAELYDTSLGAPVAPRENSENGRTELLAPPEPAEVIDQQFFEGVDATVVTYANGARLAYRETTITENFVQLRGVSPGGFFAVEGPELALLDRTPGLVAGSGYESVDVVTLDRLLTGSVVSLSTQVGRSEEILRGESSGADIEMMFQLIHLQMTEPLINDVQVRQFDEGWRPLASNPGSNPALAADLELWRLRYGDSPWFRLLPTVADLDALDADLQLEAYKDRFSNAGDFIFTVVGDFDPDELVDLGARYLGTLPDDGRREESVDRDPGVPEENLVGTVQAGVGDQGRVRINWESPYPFTIEAEVTARLLELVVNARLRDLIREELGASYAPNAAITILSEPKPWIDSIIEVESDPERLDEVSEVIHTELDRIRAGELDQRYVDNAITQLSESYRFFSNDDWLDLITFYLQNPDRSPAEFQNRAQIAEAATLDDIVEAAQITFPEQRSVEVRLLPADQ